MGNDADKAVNKMLAQLKEKAPELEVITPGLSVLVTGMKGPIAAGELQKSRELGGTIAVRVGEGL